MLEAEQGDARAQVLHSGSRDSVERHYSVKHDTWIILKKTILPFVVCEWYANLTKLSFALFTHHETLGHLIELY